MTDTHSQMSGACLYPVSHCTRHEAVVTAGAGDCLLAPAQGFCVLPNKVGRGNWTRLVVFERIFCLFIGTLFFQMKSQEELQDIKE